MLLLNRVVESNKQVHKIIIKIMFAMDCSVFGPQPPLLQKRLTSCSLPIGGIKLIRQTSSEHGELGT
jgi:hypothetical protein